MPATINLLPRKCFEIVLEDKTVVKGQFGTWALKRLCDKNKWSLSDAGEKLGNPAIADAIDYILAAVEYSARKENAPFSYTDVHACSWVDELGGIGENSGFVALFNHSASEDEPEEVGEKKTMAMN